MSKDFEAMIRAKSVEPLSPEERDKIRAAYGNSWKFSGAARYEETVRMLETLLEQTREDDRRETERYVEVILGHETRIRQLEEMIGGTDAGNSPEPGV